MKFRISGGMTLFDQKLMDFCLGKLKGEAREEKTS